MRAYARRYAADDESTWGIAGLLHDFDYEIHPHAPHHPLKGAEILLARGVDPAIVHAILAHADYSGVPRVSLEPASVRKKLKDKGFARAVNRDDVYRGTAELGVDLDAHIAFVVDALASVAPEVGLARA